MFEFLSLILHFSYKKNWNSKQKEIKIRERDNKEDAIYFQKILHRWALAPLAFCSNMFAKAYHHLRNWWLCFLMHLLINCEQQFGKILKFIDPRIVSKVSLIKANFEISIFSYKKVVKLLCIYKIPAISLFSAHCITIDEKWHTYQLCEL